MKLNERLHYEEDTGLFYWISSPRTDKIGTVAGTLRKDGYIQISLGKTVHLAHRLVYEYLGIPCPEVVDHKDGDRANNRFNNLRDGTGSLNSANIKEASKNNLSKTKGLYFMKNTGKWKSQIMKDGMNYYCGSFETKEEALQAYQNKQLELYNEIF